jgi:tetratricopeptide (TPR) repeat protein
VYLDETAAIFLRKTPQTADMARDLAINCSTVQIPEPAAARGSSYRAEGNAYNFLADMGSVFYLLGRDDEAGQSLARAEQIESHDPNLHLTRAQLFEADGNQADAEREYKASIKQRPTDIACYLLGILYAHQHRYPEALESMKQSARLSFEPAQRWKTVGQIENAMQQPKDALVAFDRAARIGSHGDKAEQNLLNGEIASGRAQSWLLLHDLDQAIEQERVSTQLLPNNASRWSALAQLYRQKGDQSQADKAQAKADSIQAFSKH